MTRALDAITDTWPLWAVTLGPWLIWGPPLWP